MKYDGPDIPTVPMFEMPMADLLRQAMSSAFGTPHRITWRIGVEMTATFEETVVVPACGGEYHEDGDAGIYGCCPDIVLPTGNNAAFAAWLVRTLNGETE